MLSPQSTPTHAKRREHGFTMIEVALSLAIVAFALVAIMGVMPAGLNVQRENREETIIAQDAEYLMEAIRMGVLATNLDVLRSNITLLESTAIVNGATNLPSLTWTHTPSGSPPSIGQILVHLSRPALYTVNHTSGTIMASQVRLRFKGFSGNMASLAASTNLDNSFQYEVTPRIERINLNVATTDYSRRTFMTNNLYSVTLEFRWPVLPTGNLGLGNKSFQTQVRGAIEPVAFNDVTTTFTELERFHPDHDNLLPTPGVGNGTNVGFIFRRGFARNY